MAKLTALKVKNITRPGMYGDGETLFLRVARGGSKQWMQRLTVHGKRHDIGLGSVRLVSLAEAREAAFENRKLARAGGDPLALRAARRVPTFAELLERTIEVYAEGWRSGGKTESHWRASMRDYALPRLRRLPVNAVTSADVLAVLTPIWLSKPETAKRVKRRVSAVMRLAIAEGYRADNPAGESIAAALPRHTRPRRHHRALHYSKVAEAIATINRSAAGGPTKLLHEFLILTATRSGEVRKAVWYEIDLEERVWTIPGKRTKSAREHRVPLSGRSIAILREAERLGEGSQWVFPSPRGRAVSDATVSKLCRVHGIPCTPHGYRTSFRTWAAERTNAPRAVAEAALAHAVGGVEGAYQRSDLFERRRKLMEGWARYLAGSKVPVELTNP
ncbi:MAG: tyrosine-type recombinase/integrase [Rhodospirillales bacterium]|nr:tyrosine-type recombinase/integrase [Rhodospirillales bacterium]